MHFFRVVIILLFGYILEKQIFGWSTPGGIAIVYKKNNTQPEVIETFSTFYS